MTSLWNLDSAAVESAIRPIRPDGDVREGFARAAWSFLVEPGDRIAGALVRQWGAVDALDHVIRQSSARALESDEVSQSEANDALARWSPRLDSTALFRALHSAASIHARLAVPGDDHWPSGLDDLADHGPHALWCRGEMTALPSRDSAVSIVGARASTGYGEHIAMDFAAGFTSRGMTVVSGGAYGIDGMAHRATLACGGTTVAVLAGGVDQLYPSGHEELLRRIMGSGVVVSEVSPGSAPTRWRFLQRNRLIAAMSGVTVVVEAGYRSGSLNTATHARDLDRPVAVVPGPVTSGASAGCHRLLRTNPATTLVTSVAEVLELLGTSTEVFAPSPSDSPDTIRVLDALSISAARSTDAVAASSGMAVTEVRGILGNLALEGRAIDTDGRWRRR